MIKIKVIGAAGGEVTGSSYLVQTEKANLLVDAGMFQGGKATEAKNQIPIGISPDKIDAILVTHGHLDHTGRIPMLINNGFKGPIYCTEETLELTRIILQDSAHLQVADTKRHNKKLLKEGKPLLEPLYLAEDVEFMNELFRPIELNKAIEVAEGITVHWIEAGHMLGSGSIELKIMDGNRTKTVVFSGDLGPLSSPMLKPFEHYSNADLVFIESTYGDRDHKPYEETVKQFVEIVIEAHSKGGKILVPTFAIGRAQQMIYHLTEMFQKNQIEPFPVYLDSPSAIHAFEVYNNHQDMLDDEFQELKNSGAFPLNPKYFIPCLTSDSSKLLNEVKEPCLILAGAGMCNGGRILHHLFHNIEDPNTHIIIVGFQAYGSIGRQLVDKVKEIHLFGENKVLNAQVHTLSGFSAHAGQSDLMKWFSYLAPSKPKVVIIHGENKPRNALADCIKNQYNIDCIIPELDDVIEI